VIYIKAKNLGTIVFPHMSPFRGTKSLRGLLGATVHNGTTLEYQIDTGKTDGDK